MHVFTTPRRCRLGLYRVLPTVRHKLNVLNDHCAAVGRDPSEITKTKLTTLVIRESTAEAQRVATADRTEKASRSLRSLAIRVDRSVTDFGFGRRGCGVAAPPFDRDLGDTEDRSR